MRPLIVFIAATALACSSPSSSQLPAGAEVRAEVRVDRRIELLSILQRLVGAREYKGTPATTYVAAVDNHFAPHREHPAIAATMELRNRHSITYDAPMWLAIRLDESLALRGKPGDPRWDGVDTAAYLTTVRDFVRVSGFDAFLAQHAAYHRKVEDKLRTAIAAEKPAPWFDAFFGAAPGAKFIVVPGLLTGARNFGPHTDVERYQVLGVDRVDFDELPVIDNATIELLVHEMAHSYVNPLFEAHHAALQPHGERLFAEVEDVMRKQAYPSWQIMLNEQGVRALTTLYLRDRKGDVVADAALQREVARGFRWTKPLADALHAYRASRSAERSIDSEALVKQVLAVLENAR